MLWLALLDSGSTLPLLHMVSTPGKVITNLRPARAWEAHSEPGREVSAFQTNIRISVGGHCWNMDFCSSGASHFIDVFPHLRLSVILVTIVQYLGTLNRARVTSLHCS